MGKSTNDNFLDQSLNYLKTGTQITVCTTNEPTTYAEATETTDYMLATTTMTTGDYTVGNGDTNGRKVAVAQQATISISASGVAGHIAICNSTASELILVTTCTTQQLTTGGTVTIPTFDDEIADPT
jgi:hypothetical protein